MGMKVQRIFREPNESSFQKDITHDAIKHQPTDTKKQQPRLIFLAAVLISTFQTLQSRIQGIYNILVQQSFADMTEPSFQDHRLLPQNEELVHVSTPILFLSMTPLALVAYVSWTLNLQLESAIFTGTARTFIQLSILGFILQPIFTEGVNRWYIVVLYCCFMVLLASYESSKRSKYTFRGMFLFVLMNLATNISLISIFAFGVILRPTPVWDPQYVIPIVGMLLGNCINGVSLALNNMLTLLREGSGEIDLFLAFGATPLEATSRYMIESVQTGAMPQLNSMAIIGIISIPGMMTGQILGGSSVHDAARYQMLIMYLIAVCVFGSLLVEVYVAVWVCFDQHSFILQSQERLTLNRAKKEGIVGVIKSWKNHTSMQQLLVQSSSSLAKTPSVSQQTLVISGSSDASSADETSHLMAEKQESSSIQITTVISATDPTTKEEVLVMQGFSKSYMIKSSEFAEDGSTNNGNEDTLNKASSTSTFANRRTVIFQGLSCSVRAGEIVAVQGPSGCGKSTLLRMIAGITSIDSGGTIRLNGRVRRENTGTSKISSIHNNNGDYTDWTLWRRHVRYVPQTKVGIPGTPRTFIDRICEFQVQKNDKNDKQMSPSDIYQTTCTYLQEWNMPPSSVDAEWSILSGGEGQRMLLAISLASQPRVLLLDESTSALDHTTKLCVERTVARVCQDDGLCAMWITHDAEQMDRLRQLKK